MEQRSEEKGSEHEGGDRRRHYWIPMPSKR